MAVFKSGSVAFVLLALAPWLAAATDPAQPGSFTAARETVSIPGTQGANLSTDVFYPSGAAGSVAAGALPCPVIVFGHGFSQSKSQHTNQGLHWASRGYLVLIPNFNGGSDHSRNADDLSKCLDWIAARNTDPASRYFGAVRTSRIGASGHSAGGLSALVAASRDPRIRAVAPLDPVDNNNLGVTALASVSIPVAITYSEPSSCNASGSALQLYAAAPGAKRGVKIVGANHTDPQDPAGFLSIITCGAANATRQMLYRRYVTGWFEYYLKADQSYAPYVFDLAGGQTAADRAAGSITYMRTAPASPLTEWRWTNFGDRASNDAIAGPLADPDEDGLVNLVEYALGTDPNAPSASFVPVASVIRLANEAYGAINFTRATMATDVSVTPEVSADRRSWIAATVEASHSGVGVETITARDSGPLNGTKFLRLRVSSTEPPPATAR